MVGRQRDRSVERCNLKTTKGRGSGFYFLRGKVGAEGLRSINSFSMIILSILNSTKTGSKLGLIASQRLLRGQLSFGSIPEFPSSQWLQLLPLFGGFWPSFLRSESLNFQKRKIIRWKGLISCMFPFSDTHVFDKGNRQGLYAQMDTKPRFKNLIY